MRERFARTIPVWPVDAEGKCTCPQKSGCKRPAKHADERAPVDGNHAYAVVTGALDAGGSGVFVVDIDTKGAVDGFAQFVRFLGDEKLADTLTVNTPTGGMHIYFKHPGFPVTNRKLDSAIDIRGDRKNESGMAYVIGPGSPGKTPGTYYVENFDVPILYAPEILLAWLRASGNATRKEDAEEVTPLEREHPEYAGHLAEYRVLLSVEEKFPGSHEDGNASLNLMRAVDAGVRKRRLHKEDVLDALNECWNIRCTKADGVTPDPWSDDDIARAIVSCALEGYSLPGEAIVAKKMHAVLSEHANPNRAVKMPSPVDATGARVPKRRVAAGECNADKRHKLDRSNVAQLLYSHPDWDGVLNWDVLKRRPFAIDPPFAGRLTLSDGRLSKGDIAQIALWFDLNNFQISKEAVEDALWNVVRMPDRQVNAIAKYLDALPVATDSSCLDTLATDVLKSTDPFANELVKKTLIAAVRRARNPGHRHRAMLVLKGEQYCGKTAFVRILAGDWYHSTANGDLTNRDTKLECAGNLLVEVEELSAMNKADENALKTAISMPVDVITKKYEPDADVFPRSYVFIGTTNKDEFLTDATGNTRYWVVQCGQVDIAKLIELRDRIWAEADFLARITALDSNELKDTDALKRLEEDNAAYLNSHPWLETVREYLAGKDEVSSATEVLSHVLKGDLTHADKRQKNEVAGVMRMLGCTVAWRGVKETRVKFWRMPSEISGRVPKLAKVLVLPAPKK